jgi:signal transduction histidine kinase
VITNRTRDGRLFDQEQTISPLFDEAGSITHFISIGRDVTSARRTEAARLHQLLEQEASRVVTLLHAEAGQLLTSAHLTLCAMTAERTSSLPRDVEAVRGVLDRVEALLRRAAHGAQPRVIADLGLVDAIRYLAEDCATRTGVVFSIESAIDRRCPAASETLVYRFVQETLAAVPRMAQPANARIQLRREVQGRRAQDETLCCTIRLADRGEAFWAPFSDRDGGGLRLVRDRLESVGGTLTGGAAGGKVELQATVPLGA